jgi:hypothetical protein
MIVEQSFHVKYLLRTTIRNSYPHTKNPDISGISQNVTPPEDARNMTTAVFNTIHHSASFIALPSAPVYGVAGVITSPVRVVAPRAVSNPPSLAAVGAAALFRRRRIVAAVLAVMFLIVVAYTSMLATTAYFTSTAGAADHSQTTAVTVVQPGDTMWSIATGIASDGDIRSTVDGLIELNGTSALVVGQRLTLPAS